MTNELNLAISKAAERMNEFVAGSGSISYPGSGLPYRAKIIDITDGLRSVMFPGFFGMPSYEHNKYGTGYKLISICTELKRQMIAAYKTKYDDEQAELKAEATMLDFVAQLPDVQKVLATDVEALFNGDPAANSTVDVIFSYPGLIAITIYRIAHLLYKSEVPLIPRMMTEYAHSLTGIDINAGATIGNYFFIDHGTGIVIGETTEIGDNVKLYQGVTLGALSLKHGQLLSGKKRHPTIGNNVTVYSGASILGGDTVIGDDCVIGGNAFVTRSVPAGTKVYMKEPELTYRDIAVDSKR